MVFFNPVLTWSDHLTTCACLRVDSTASRRKSGRESEREGFKVDSGSEGGRGGRRNHTIMKSVVWSSTRSDPGQVQRFFVLGTHNYSTPVATERSDPPEIEPLSSYLFAGTCHIRRRIRGLNGKEIRATGRACPWPEVQYMQTLLLCGSFDLRKTTRDIKSNQNADGRGRRGASCCTSHPLTGSEGI